MKRSTVGLAAAACFFAGQAHAQAVFSGDCERARAIQSSTPLSQRFSGRYSGASIFSQTSETCGRKTVLLLELTPKSSAADKVVYDLTRASYRMAKSKGDCPDIELISKSEYGTVTFTYALVQQTGYCDLRVNATFQLYDRTSSWSHSFTQRVSFLSSTHFAITIETGNGAMIFQK